MWAIIINNLSDLALGSAWTGLCLWAGSRLGRRLERRKLRKAGLIS